MNWFHNDGGPLVVLPRSPAPLWEGTDLPSNGRRVEAHFRFAGPTATDYDRACDVADPAELLEAGQGWVLVLGGVIQEAAWLPLAADDFLVVSEDWIPDKGEQTLRKLYADLSDDAPMLIKHELRIDRGGLVLTHAGSTLSDADVHAFDSPPERG